MGCATFLTGTAYVSGFPIHPLAIQGLVEWSILGMSPTPFWMSYTTPLVTSTKKKHHSRNVSASHLLV